MSSKVFSERGITKRRSISSVRFTWQNWLWGFSIFCALVILVPLVILYQAPHFDFNLPLIIAGINATYSGTRLALLALDGRKKLLSLTFWTFAYVWMGIAPLAQLSAKYFPWPSAYTNWTLAYSAIIVFVGYVAYDAGSWLGGLYYSRGGGSLSRLNRVSISKRKTYVLSFIASLIAAISIYRLGGFDLLFSPRLVFEQEVSSDLTKTGNLIWNSLLRAPAFVSLVLSWWVWRNRQRFSVRGPAAVWHAALLLSLLTLNLIVSNPISSPRFFYGTVVLTIAFMLLGWNKRHSFGIWITGLLLALLVIFPYANISRSENQSLTFRSVVEPLVGTGDYDAFQQLINTVTFVSANGITFGYQLLGALFFWVPRSVWPDKPYGSGQLVAEQAGYPFTNLSSPLWAEAYINAGIIGVFLVLLLYGFASSLLQNLYIASYKGGVPLIAVLVPILAAYQLFFLRGDLQNGIAYLTPIVIYLLLAGKTRYPWGGSHK